MIRTILAIGLLAVLVGCEPKPFKGIIRYIGHTKKM